MMKKNKTFSGFTMVEVVLFLAISGAIVAALIAGASTPIKQQRYNDAVQDFTSFLQSEYSGASDIKNISDGAEKEGHSIHYAIYGKLVSFTGVDASTAMSYMVIGNIKIDATSYNSTLDAFKSSDMNLMVSCKQDDISSYTTTFGATITNESGGPYKGSVLILRSPLTGVLYTYEGQEFNGCSGGENMQEISVIASSMQEKEINFCMKMDETGITGNKRRNVRIDKDVHGISSVRLVPLDKEDNKCI